MDSLSPLNPECGFRLASLADGEGCFAITRRFNRRGGPVYSCSFIVKMRADDRAILRRFQLATGLGKVYDLAATPGPGRASHPSCSWQVGRIADCAALVAIFDEYPLWSKKQRDYFIWREAVLLRHRGCVMARELERCFDELRAVRVYQPQEGNE